jgi:hypothetical protein
MNATYGSRQTEAGAADPEAGAVLHALAGVSDAQGLGVVMIRNGIVCPVRQPTPPGARWLVVEFRPAAAAPPPPPDLHEHTSSEWIDLGMNCTGLLLAGAGTVGTAALAPETGGLSFGASVYMASQTAVAAGQCSVSIYRVWNIYHDNEAANEAMDRSRLYHVVMYTADAYALLDVAKTGIESMRYARDIAESEVSFSRLLSEQLNRNERLRLTEALDLQGARRVAAARLTMDARTRIAQAIGAALALSGSARSGVIQSAGQQLYVWAIDSSAIPQRTTAAGSSSAGAPQPSLSLP